MLSAKCAILCQSQYANYILHHFADWKRCTICLFNINKNISGGVEDMRIWHFPAITMHISTRKSQNYTYGIRQYKLQR